MSEMTLPTRHRIRNSNSGGLRPSTRPLVTEAPHNTKWHVLQFSVVDIRNDWIIIIFLNSAMLLVFKDTSRLKFVYLFPHMFDFYEKYLFFIFLFYDEKKCTSALCPCTSPPSKHDTFILCWFNVRTALKTVAQH